MNYDELPSKDKYISTIKTIKALWNFKPDRDVEWSSPLYKCPNCGGPVRKNLTSYMLITSPLICSYEYTCDDCKLTERIYER